MSYLFLCLGGPIRDDRRCSYLDRHSRSDSEAPRRRFHVLRVRAALGRQALLILLLLLFFFLSAFIAFSRCRDEQTEQRKKSKSPHDDFQWRLSSARMRRNNQAEEKPNVEHTFQPQGRRTDGPGESSANDLKLKGHAAGRWIDQ